MRNSRSLGVKSNGGKGGGSKGKKEEPRRRSFEDEPILHELDELMQELQRRLDDLEPSKGDRKIHEIWGSHTDAAMWW